MSHFETKIVRPKIVFLLFIGFVLSFQNCNHATIPQDTNEKNQENVVENTAHYEIIRVNNYFLKYQTSNRDMNTSVDILRINLRTEEMTLKKDENQEVTCWLDSERAYKLETLLRAGELCTPKTADAGTMNCMAMSVSDIYLVDSEKTRELSRPLCGNGLFLCGGDDENFRNILSTLIDDPPAGCQSL